MKYEIEVLVKIPMVIHIDTQCASSSLHDKRYAIDIARRTLEKDFKNYPSAEVKIKGFVRDI